MRTSRPQRVAEVMRQEIADLIQRGLKDPRIGFVSVMDVRMSPDLRYANVFVSLYGDESAQKSSLIGLQQASGWVRRQIGQRVRLRYTPEIRFFPDSTLDNVYHLEEVFKEIHETQRQTPMRKASLNEIVDSLRAADRFLLTTHANPDGDAVGSVLGLAHLLSAVGKKHIACVIADPVPRIYQFLPGHEKIRLPEGPVPEHDLLVLLDAGQLKRSGGVADWLEGYESNMLVIDHHLEDGENGSTGFIDASYAATGEIVAELWQAADTPLTSDAALCLYVAQVTDTGGFRYANTNARSHEIATRFMAFPLDIAGISNRVFDRMSTAKFELLRRTLDRMTFAAGGRLAYTYVEQSDLEQTGGSKEDLEGLVNYGRNIEGVSVAMFFNAVKPDVTKVSFRAAGGFNAAEFLRPYGGGGHAGAAGATIEAPRERIQAEIVAKAAAILEQTP